MQRCDASGQPMARFCRVSSRPQAAVRAAQESIRTHSMNASCGFLTAIGEPQFGCALSPAVVQRSSFAGTLF